MPALSEVRFRVACRDEYLVSYRDNSEGVDTRTMVLEIQTREYGEGLLVTEVSVSSNSRRGIIDWMDGVAVSSEKVISLSSMRQ